MQVRIPRLLSHPVVWLLPLFAAIWAALRDNQFLVISPSNDTLSYDLASKSSSLGEALGSLRTLGYPLFLRLLRPFSADYSAAPTAHLLLFFAAVLLFWLALRRYTGSKWLAFAWTLPLAYPCNLAFVRFVQPDFLGPTLAIAALALLVLLAGAPRNPLFWLLVTVAVFSAYQMRPDNLFLVGLVPVWGVLLLLGRRVVDGRRLLQVGAGLALATVLPLVAFISMRGLLVGQFSLVSFGGYNLVGITASFLDDELVARLPEESAALGREILAERQAGGLEPYGPSSWTRRWHQQYSPNVWRVAEPVARRLLTDAPAGNVPPLAGEAVFEINRGLTELSREVILRRPLLYGKWIRDGFKAGLGMTFQCMLFGQLAILLVASIPILLLRARRAGGGGDRELEDRMLRLCVLAHIGVSYFLAKLLLIVMVSVPYERHVFPAMALLPCVLAAGLYELWRWILMAPAPTADAPD